MIVVVASRHDREAAGLVDAWPTASLCSAEDLTRPGWAWWPTGGGTSCWVVDGAIVDDEQVTGVFVRRSAVYPEEFLGTHADDRAYMASEAHAFLVFVLSRTAATVANRSAEGFLGDEALGPERWMPAASAAGVAVSPVRAATRPHRQRPLTLSTVQVVGDRAIGDAPAVLQRRARAVSEGLGLLWATVVFDGRHRLVDVTSARPPGAEAAEALGDLLARPRFAP